MASALNAPRGYSANLKKTHPRLVRSAESKKAPPVKLRPMIEGPVPQASPPSQNTPAEQSA
jgi:hypothetical protein